MYFEGENDHFGDLSVLYIVSRSVHCKHKRKPQIMYVTVGSLVCFFFLNMLGPGVAQINTC